MPTKREKDDITGTETTGHEWDGIKELDTPLPSWWVWVFIACIIWSIGYVIFYPAIPGPDGASEGVLGYSQREVIADELAAREVARADIYAQLNSKSVRLIEQSPQLHAFALRGGEAAFADNCAPCHGAAGSGRPGYPALGDDDWLWGGTADAIEATIRYGVRSGHDEEHFSQMPGFADLLSISERRAITQFVMSISGDDAETGGNAITTQGGALYADNCSSCHGQAGEGVREMGGPALNDAIWLYGRSAAKISAQIANPNHGVMPAWEGRLDDATLKMLTVYVFSLGGGESE